MLKKLSALLIMLLALTLCASALADCFATPLRHGNQDFRDVMWQIIIHDVAPQVGAQPQEKWSAARCREVVDLFEEAGFTITDEVKDELYRTPRDHRWYASEAWMILMESLFDREWYWSIADMNLFAQAKANAGMIVDRYLLPDAATPSLEEVLALFRQQIALHPAMADDPPEGYHMVARLMDWGGSVRWELCAYPDLDAEFPRADYAMTYHIGDRTFTMDDYRLRNALSDYLN